MSASRFRALALLALFPFSSAFAQQIPSVSFASLLDEMVNRDVIARFPQPAYTCRQSSSYDRDAVSPDDQRTWYANMDRSQFVRIEDREGRKEYVLHDAEGPGVIVRIWATWHGPGGGEFSNGKLRIYLDGEDQPAIEGSASEVIDQGLLAGPPLSEGVSPETPYAHRGHNLYLPIPYSKHCKVTYSTEVPVDRGAHKGEALYYQINYRTYTDPVKVESFSLDTLKANREKVDATNKQLSQGIQNADGTRARFNCRIEPGRSSTPIRFVGPAALRVLQFRLVAEDIEQALRSTVLEIDFDGEQAVWCPVGEFFGTGYKLRPYKSWYTRVSNEEILSCAWIMPFMHEARFVLHNLGEQPVEIGRSRIIYAPWDWDDRSLHFHANWHQLTEAETRGSKDISGSDYFDVNYVTAEGEGVYVGDTLTLCNGAAAWWGEGDEKIFVDGESFPSHFGTGTEDYYGYAWSNPNFFESPFHAQPDGSGDMAGGFAVNSRYRLLDAIPFRKSLKFDMELWHWADTKINFAPTTFWYARPGALSNIQPDPKTVALPVARERTDIVPVHRIEGALEGEDLTIASSTGGKTEVQHGGYGWSGEAQLWWIDGKVGDKLVIEFPAVKAGRYHVRANLTKARDYGIVEMTVNDAEPHKFDRYDEKVQSNVVDLGSCDLSEGTNRLTIEIAGTNEKALPRLMFGLDYLQLEPVEN